MVKSQFMNADLKLDLIRDDAKRQENELVKERERLREIRRDTDFAEEHLDHRIVKQDRVWAKALIE